MKTTRNHAENRDVNFFLDFRSQKIPATCTNRIGYLLWPKTWPDGHFRKDWCCVEPMLRQGHRRMISTAFWAGSSRKPEQGCITLFNTSWQLSANCYSDPFPHLLQREENSTDGRAERHRNSCSSGSREYFAFLRLIFSVLQQQVSRIFEISDWFLRLKGEATHIYSDLRESIGNDVPNAAGDMD